MALPESTIDFGFVLHMVKQFLALLDVCEILRVIVRTIFWATFAIGVANFSALCWTLAFHFAFALGSESSAFQGAITVLVPPETNVHTEDLFSWAGVVARNVFSVIARGREAVLVRSPDVLLIFSEGALENVFWQRPGAVPRAFAIAALVEVAIEVFGRLDLVPPLVEV